MDDEQDIIKFFTRCPNFVFYGLPDLPVQAKWVLLALMSMCWDRRKSGMTLKELEGPYRLSLREIASLTGVDHAILKSKEGKSPREGILNILQALEYITIISAKPINEMTGRTGRSQTYLYIRLEKIWLDNISFSKTWNAPTGRLVNIDTIIVD